jgi:hypothetical protein
MPQSNVMIQVSSSITTESAIIVSILLEDNPEARSTLWTKIIHVMLLAYIKVPDVH